MSEPRDQDLFGYAQARAERILARVEKVDGCWLWTGPRDTNGYGQISVNHRRNLRAHRAVWMLHNRQPVPDGLTLDHLCLVRRCVNPEHLEPVTMAENTRRAGLHRWDGAAIRVRVTSKGVTRYNVNWRDRTGDEVKQRGRTFGTLDEAEAFVQQIAAERRADVAA